jgi:hypothetical protein
VWRCAGVPLFSALEDGVLPTRAGRMNMRNDYGLCLAEFQEEAMQIIYRKRPDLAGKSLEEIREILNAKIPAKKVGGDAAAR